MKKRRYKVENIEREKLVFLQSICTALFDLKRFWVMTSRSNRHASSAQLYFKTQQANCFVTLSLVLSDSCFYQKVFFYQKVEIS